MRDADFAALVPGEDEWEDGGDEEDADEGVVEMV